MIYRDTHNGNFTQVSNTLLLDARLRPIDIYIMMLLLRRPNDWAANKQQIEAESRLNKATVLASFRRLESCGYLIWRSGGRDARGRIIKNLYDIRENAGFQPSPKNGDGKVATDTSLDNPDIQPSPKNGGCKTAAVKRRLKNGGCKTTTNNIIYKQDCNKQQQNSLVVVAKMNEVDQKIIDKWSVGATVATLLAEGGDEEAISRALSLLDANPVNKIRNPGAWLRQAVSKGYVNPDAEKKAADSAEFKRQVAAREEYWRQQSAAAAAEKITSPYFAERAVEHMPKISMESEEI